MHDSRMRMRPQTLTHFVNIAQNPKKNLMSFSIYVLNSDNYVQLILNRFSVQSRNENPLRINLKFVMSLISVLV
jgi:hypothetical protein